jgi:YbgC/YbaW family acyl-CoA thioester hydrolase
MADGTGRESVREIEVEWGDLDSLGIVFYPRMFAWADAAAHQLFRAAGVPMDLLLERKMGFGLVSASASFESPARYGERLLCRSVVSKLGGKTLELTHRLVRAASGGVSVATLRETRVCMDIRDAASIRARALPDDVVAALRAYVADEATAGRKE